MIERCVKPRRTARVFLLAAGVLLLAADSFALWPFRSGTSFEVRQAWKYTSELMHAGRYAEAASVLKMELQTQPLGTWRFRLLMRLSEAQEKLLDVSGMAQTLAQADATAKTSAQKKSVTRKLTRLWELQAASAPPPLVQAGELVSAAEDTTATSDSLALVTVSNSFFETDLRQALTDISQQTGVPIQWDRTVEGLVTYEARNQTIETVLQAILLPGGYTFRLVEGTYYVGSGKPEDPLFAMLSETEVVGLANIAAAEAIAVVSESYKPFVKAAPTGNAVCVTAPAALTERIRADLALLDRPPEQILIEVIVCEFSTDALRQMGLDWSLTRTAGRNPSWGFTTEQTDVSQPALSATYTDLGYKIGNYTADLAASVQLLEQSGDAKIRANPRITTLNGRTAEISLLRDQYFIIQTGSSQFYQYNTLQAVSSGIKLEITPFASPSGEITVKVKPEVGDVVGSAAEGLPVISRRAASTSVRVKDGETFTIGGLNLQQENRTKRKIPFLGDIPFLGYLFRYDETGARSTEIVIFVTPHILSP